MSREGWDREAATFDAEPDHGLADPLTGLRGASRYWARSERPTL